MSLSGMLDSATLNAQDEVLSPKQAPKVKPVASSAKASAPMILPAHEIARNARKSKEEGNKEMFTSPTWSGVSGGDEHNFSFASSVSPPARHAPQSTQPAKQAAPAVLPAHEIARNARKSKEAPAAAPQQQWAGLSSSFADDHNQTMYGATSPEPPRHRPSQDSPKLAAEVKPSTPSVLPKWEIEKQAAKAKVGGRRPSYEGPTQWGGLSSSFADDHNQTMYGATSPEPPRPAPAAAPTAAAAPKAPAVLPIFAIEKAAQKAKAEKAERASKTEASFEWRGLSNELNDTAANVPSPQTGRRNSLSGRSRSALEIS